MKHIKLVIYGVIILILIGVGFKVYRYFNKPPIVTVTIPNDSTFSPIAETTYRPASIPIIENPKKPKVQLPSNLREKDVAKVITITKKTDPKDTTNIIIDKDGNYHVSKQGGLVDKVEITTYLDPILSWDWYVRLGINGNAEKVSPMVGISFLKIYGRIYLPAFSLDINGIGVGLDYKLFEPVSVGVIYHNSWQTDKSIRLTLCWNL